MEKLFFAKPIWFEIETHPLSLPQNASSIST